MSILRRGDLALGTALALALFCLGGCGDGSGSDTKVKPTITGINPAQGPASGGTTVEITGARFDTPDGVSVRFGTALVTSVDVIDANNLRCVTPSHSPGDVDVTVEYQGRSGNSLVDGFTYLPGPAITNITPTEGSEDGGTAVTFTGTDFEAGALVYFGSTPATNVVVTGTTTLDCDTPAHSPGSVDITVLNPSGGGTLEESAYTFVPVPEVDAVLPGHGAPGGGTAVTITGSGFRAGAVVQFGGTDATSIVVTSSTAISCQTPAGAGAVNVRVENAADAFDELANGFVYSANDPPFISSVTPDDGPRNTATSITISGTGFEAGSTVTVDGVAVSAFVFVDSGTITCDVPTTVGAGPADVTVTNSDSLADTLEDGFTYWPRWVFTANIAEGTVSAMALDEDDGTLACERTEPVAGPNRIEAGNGYLFVTHGGGVNMYSIDPETGALTLSDSETTGGTQPMGVVYDPVSDYLFVANYGSNSVASFIVDTVAGSLTPATASPFPAAGFGPLALALDTGSGRLLVLNEVSETVVCLDVGAGAVLSLGAGAQPPAATGPDPRAIAFGDAGGTDTLFCLNFGDNTISVYSVDGAGLITDLGAPFSPVTGLGTVLASGEGIVFDDANDILLVANQVPSSISAYGVLGGFLIPLPGSPFATGGSAPQAMAFVDDTPTQWLFTALGGSDEVAAHEYDLATPELDGVTGSPFDSVGEMPVDIAADD